MTHGNNITDKDPFFEINDVTRKIVNSSSSEIAIVQFDHNSERFTFRLNKNIEGHDMTECNKIEVHYKNTDATTLAETLGVYEITDLQVDPDDETKIVCTWLISQNATQRVGKLDFLLRFACVDTDGTIKYAWNTSIFTGIMVSAGLYNAEEILQLYTDVLEQWKQELFSASAEGVENIYTARASSLADIQTEKNKACDTVEQKGQSVADSLPDDYIKLSDKVKNVSNTLKGTAKSTNSLVSMHDVSPLEHIMSVNVKKKNNSITWSDIKVKKYGKNILDVANAPMYHCNPLNALYKWVRTGTGFKATFVRGGNITINHGMYIGTIDELKNKTITISAKFKGMGKNVIALNCTEIDGTTVQSTEDPGYYRPTGYTGASGTSVLIANNAKEATTDENVKVSFIVPDSTTYDRLYVSFYLALGGEITEDMIANNTAVTEWSDIQIEIGEGSPVSTEYVPYQEPVTYIPNEDGTIEGVTSLYPTTTLMTDTPGVIINCDYNRDINKAYDELTQAILSLGGNI